MARVIALARRGIGSVEPNPYVGCVVVKNGAVIAEGYHSYYGGPHAEAAAILAKRRNSKILKNATMYVNLEPCRHKNKKTPPCVPLIINSGIKRVVMSIKDPNPGVDGRGISDLTAAGIKCKTGVLAEAAAELNKVYLKNIKHKLPYVTLKSAMTIDGKIADFKGDSKWITSASARRYTHDIRAKHDAILVGSNTVIKDNPSLTAHGKGKNPLRVIIDPLLKTPHNSKIFREPGLNILVVSDKLKDLKRARTTFLQMRLDENIFSLKKLLMHLFERGIRSVLREGGGETNYAALKEGVVDELLLFCAPKILGGRESKTPVEGRGFSINKCATMEFKEIKKIGVDLLIRAKIKSDRARF